MPFNPKPEYTITSRPIPIRDFYNYRDEFVTRPPYQRKSVWTQKKKQSLLDSLFRRYYIPKIVVREVRLDDNKTINEVIDGQQRIITVQEFFNNELRLPKSLEDIHRDLPYKLHKELNSEFKRFIDRELQYDADLVRGIEDPRDPEHQKIATEIFWRLQQGESLNSIEIAHARLASLARNFVVKYADDITFDFEEYLPVDKNPNKHKIFQVIKRDNNRMQNLQLLARFLLLEKANGPAELKDIEVTSLIEESIVPGGIGNYSYENEKIAKDLLSNLNLLFDIFKNDPMLDETTGLKELRKEYLVISFYLLLRHLRIYYVINDEVKVLFRDFLIEEFYPRWSEQKSEDSDILLFSSNRQQDRNSIETRDIIVRQLFFEYAANRNVDIKAKDEQRLYNENQKIRIFRRDDGLCQMCLADGKNEKEAKVSWSQYEADHIFAYTKGGETSIENAQVLCRYHNNKKSGN